MTKENGLIAIWAALLFFVAANLAGANLSNDLPLQRQPRRPLLRSSLQSGSRSSRFEPTMLPLACSTSYASGSNQDLS